MRRRSSAGDERVKARGRKRSTPEHRNAPKATRDRGVSIAGQQIDPAQLAHELNEALEQQTATSEILKIISSSPASVQVVLDTVVANAARLCRALNATVYLRDGDTAVIHAQFGRGGSPVGTRRPLYGDWVTGRAVLEARTIHVPDLLSADEYPKGKEISLRLGYRTLLAVPLLRSDCAIGAILATRREANPFTESEIGLLQNFAAQAVIAIENAQLLNELRQRTTDLGEALEQQTATADVLHVISSSPGDLKPVFDAILGNATRICEAKFGALLLSEGGAFRVVAMHNPPRAYAELRQREPIIQPGGNLALTRAIATKRAVQIADATDDPANQDDPVRSSFAAVTGARSFIVVPMLKDNEVIGVINVYRQEVRPFADKQIALLTNFAAQAVIAIENARLLNELRQRTTDLSEALDQQTATADVLRVISSSPGELEPVFRPMLEKAVRLCDATFGFLHLYEDGKFITGATRYNPPPAFAEDVVKRGQLHPGPLHPLVRMSETKQLLHIYDYAEDPAYKQGDPMAVRLVELAGARTLIEVPMLKEGDLIGAIAIYRQEVRPFTDKQIALVQNFAAQAVIAIENARLLHELRERTAEVVKLNQQLEQRVTDQVGEIERMSRLRRFLPPQVADLIVASGTENQLESHRREITALFCDLRGFTGFSESSDPEDVMALLRDYHAAIGQIITKYSGTLERFAGDGVMVIFNDPVPVENPALQAVLMALDMRTAIGTMIEKWRDLGHDLGFGIGIAHGFATLGTIGFEGRFDYAAIGTVSNVASRLCDEAKPGQILISPRVRLAVDKAVTIEVVGEFTLKGIRRPMTAYNVLAASPSITN